MGKSRRPAKRKPLLDILTALHALPPEILRHIFSYLPKRSLLELKYGQGKIREVASSLVHQKLRICGGIGSQAHLLSTIQGIGSYVRHLFTMHCNTDEVYLPPELLTEQVFPQIQSVSIIQYRNVWDLGAVLEKLAVLPLLESLHLQCRDEMSALIMRSSKRGDMDRFFPSLRSLQLRGMSKSICKYMLNKRKPLPNLRRLNIKFSLISALRPKAFPRGLTSLKIDSCPSVGWSDVLRVVRRSKDTLENLSLSCGRESRLLDFVSSPIYLPRLTLLALDEPPEDCWRSIGIVHAPQEIDSLEDGEIPAWSNGAIGFYSRLDAPILECLGLGYILIDTPPAGIRDLARGKSTKNIKHFLASHFAPTSSYDDTAEDAKLARNIDLLHGELAGTEAKLLCLGEEEYDAYMNDKLCYESFS